MATGAHRQPKHAPRMSTQAAADAGLCRSHCFGPHWPCLTSLLRTCGWAWSDDQCALPRQQSAQQNHSRAPHLCRHYMCFLYLGRRKMEELNFFRDPYFGVPLEALWSDEQVITALSGTYTDHSSCSTGPLLCLFAGGVGSSKQASRVSPRNVGCLPHNVLRRPPMVSAIVRVLCVDAARPHLLPLWLCAWPHSQLRPFHRSLCCCTQGQCMDEMNRNIWQRVFAGIMKAPLQTFQLPPEDAEQ